MYQCVYESRFRYYLYSFTARKESSSIGDCGRIYTETYTGEWFGRGWVDRRRTRSRPQRNKKTVQNTTAQYLVSRMIQKAPHNREEQHDPAIGFSSYLLPGVLENVYNAEPFYRCTDSEIWFRGRGDQVPQPLNITYDKQFTTVQELIDDTLHRDNMQESKVRRDRCSSGFTQYMRFDFTPINPRPTCVLLGVTRLEVFSGSRVEEFPITPSESLTIFDKRYKLTCMSIKSGTQARGHWIACVHTKTGWYKFDDLRVSAIPDIREIKNGVQFIYEEEDIPLLPVERVGLPNNSFGCWANTFTQMIRYSPTFAQIIGSPNVLPTFTDLLSLIDFNI